MNEIPQEFRGSPTILAQRTICERYGAEFRYADTGGTIGLARNIRETDLLPINGLRHPPNGQSTGWFIWRGEELSEDDDFFQPYHVVHVHQIVRETLPYLGLAPGWRFLIARGCEDVWFDTALLDVEPVSPEME